MTANLFWLHGGGDPHGMGSAPGIWQPIMIVSWCVLVVALIFAILGKGKGRFFSLSALPAILVAQVLVAILQMD
jgi:hypothetical protein